MTRFSSLLFVGFVLLVFEAALGTVTRIGPLMPNAVLPIVLYAAMAPDLPLARAAVLSFLLGMLVDSASGNAMGPMTFVHVATLVCARAGSLRLAMRGRVSQILLTALVSAVGSALMVGLRNIFRPDEGFKVSSTKYLLITITAHALATGAIAPFVFQLVRRIDTRSRRDESASFA